MKNTYPDVETSSQEYAGRFRGDVGRWFLEVQGGLVREMAIGSSGNKTDLSALDFGGGHGQLIRPLVDSGFRTTVLGSDESCANLLREDISNGTVNFLKTDLLKSGLPDRSYTLVTCIRLLTHMERWQELVAELCRVADKAVIVDYPPLASFNLLYPLLFSLKRAAEKNTRTFRVFSHSEMIAEFVKNGFYLKAKKGQFFLPMVTYRVIKSRLMAEMMELPFACTGLTGLLGSPAMALFERKKA